MKQGDRRGQVVAKAPRMKGRKRQMKCKRGHDLSSKETVRCAEVKVPGGKTRLKRICLLCKNGLERARYRLPHVREAVIAKRNPPLPPVWEWLPSQLREARA